MKKKKRKSIVISSNSGRKRKYDEADDMPTINKKKHKFKFLEDKPMKPRGRVKRSGKETTDLARIKRELKGER